MVHREAINSLLENLYAKKVLCCFFNLKFAQLSYMTLVSFHCSSPSQVSVVIYMTIYWVISFKIML